ncbi:MAG: hypothetical protein R3284_10850 [Rubricoccaceae bacterium]|nr:hypothetical protein [Rubricoccaceae bacterium]
MNEQNNKRFKQMLAVAAILGVLSSAVVYNVMTTRAFNVSGAFPAEGLGENGDLAGQCQFMFDTYLLNTNVWKNRISNFAKAFFQQIIGQAYTRAWCSIPEFEKCKEVGGSLVISFKVNLCIRTPRPSCDVGKGDIMTSAMFEDIAERSLLYDQVANCQAWAMTNGIMDAAQQT